MENMEQVALPQEQQQEQSFIPGTSFKTPEELAKGYMELKSLHDRQANELGSLRKDREYLSSHAESLASLLKEQMGRSQQTAAPVEAPMDYGREIATVKTALENLDPTDDNFVRQQAGLTARLVQLAQAEQHERTLSASSNYLKEELSKRDARDRQQKFLDENPTFNAPDMQARIREYISRDRSGMHDAVSAYFQIQRDDLAAQASEIAKQNEEMKKILDLAKGKETADKAKVVVKGQSPSQQQTNRTKAMGKDLDAGMAAILQSMRGT